MSAQDVAAAIVTTTHHVDTSIFGMLASADFVSKTIILILLMSSAWSWIIIVKKWQLCSFIKKNIAEFEKTFWSGQVLDTLHDRLKKSQNDPLASIFIEGMNEYKRHKSKGSVSDSALKVGVKERMLQIMDLECSKEAENIDSQLGFLALVGSSATFMGLLGTVWGIMTSFQSIAASSNTSLAVVAPGIAEALLLTAIGLFAAIPATAAYNILSGKTSEIINKMEDFVVELHTILSRTIDDGRM